jgi:superfamily II DNA/RNA helicase
VPPNGNFENFPEIDRKTVDTLIGKGFKNLFPIQQHCFYPVFNREDMIARDLTGSGKTFAFGLPVIQYLRKNNLMKTGRTQAIIIAPTRELALQITGELNKIKHSVEEFKIVTVYGGVSVMEQANALKAGVDLFVGTTGRVLDHIERGNIDFSDLKTIVLDEADVMLKLGFKEDIEKILSKVHEVNEKTLQILLFSATVPAWVRDIAKEHMRPDFRVVDLA